MTRLNPALALAFLAATASSPALADEKSETVVRLFDKLDLKLAADNGLIPGGFFSQGRLPLRSSSLIKLHLEGGHKTEIVAMCDHDCDAIDMQLTTPSGRLVRGNDGNAETPVVEAGPEVAGDFIVRLRMLKCSRAPCAYGVKTFVPDE
jgi:hypothetical protein